MDTLSKENGYPTPRNTKDGNFIGILRHGPTPFVASIRSCTRPIMRHRPADAPPIKIRNRRNGPNTTTGPLPERERTCRDTKGCATPRAYANARAFA